MPEQVTHEEWRPVPGWGNYDVSCYGRVRRGGRTLKLASGRAGRRIFSLCRDGQIRQVAIAPLVLRLFVGPPLPGQECRHFPDPDPGNNHVENLRWGQRWENDQDKAVQGGVGHNKRLRADEVREARRLLASGVLQKVIAAQFGITKGAVSAIKRGKSWRYVS